MVSALDIAIVICVIALLFACAMVLIQSKKADARLDERLTRYKQE